MRKRRLTVCAVLGLFVALVLIVACTSPEGSVDPARPQRSPDPQGPTRVAVEDTAVTAGVEHASSEICSICHSELYEDFLESDHLWKPAKAVEGQSPAYPFTEVTSPPEGFGWDNIAYVIGGHNWKARFIDQNGYIITGDAEATTSTTLPTK